MNQKKVITIELNGKKIKAIVTVSAPELDAQENFVNANMILLAAANGKSVTYQSRHRDILTGLKADAS